MTYLPPLFTQRFTLACILPLTIAACGGEGGGAASTGSAAARSGKVYLQAGVANALVCLDLQGDQQCHANSPSATTDADGNYQLPQPRNAADAQAFASAPVLAQISGSQGAYTLLAPAEKSEQINPLTTLVQRHMTRSGVSLETAEHAVAQQLGIDTAHIYDYALHSIYTPSFAAASQDIEHRPEDNARTAALLTAYGLEHGFEPMTYTPSDTIEDTEQLVALNFQDINNYEYDLHTTDKQPNSAGQILWNPSYGGIFNGHDRTYKNISYAGINIAQAIFTGKEEYLRSQGNPARIQINPVNKMTPFLDPKFQIPELQKTTLASFEILMDKIDISEVKISDIFQIIQKEDAKSNTVTSQKLLTLDPSLVLHGSFPKGSYLYKKMRTRVADTQSYVSTFDGSKISVSGKFSTDHHLPFVANDLNPTVNSGLHKNHNLQTNYTLNAAAWNAIKAELNIR